MMNGPIPMSYEEWRHCITVECGIPLTPDFIEKRLAVWQKPDVEETRRFRDLYGEAYLQTIIAWFERAKRELA
ncbi:MAG: hypothetical protein AAAFM81_04260 [Pseudomonadota bacterium]